MTGQWQDEVNGIDLDLGLDLLGQSLELLHVGLAGRPVDAETLSLVGLGDHVEVDVVNLLVSNGAVVLKDVVVRSACGVDELLEGRQDLTQLVIGDIGELGAVELGNDESMALAEGADVEEGQSLVALEELEARDLALDDAAEDAGHFRWKIGGA